MQKPDANLIIFIAILATYVAGQFLIGTYHPIDRKFVFDAPSDVDFLYYGAIANSLLNEFPPENPAFAGTNLTQPFLQYYPVAILAKIFNPYNGIRILNVVYLILFGLLLRHFFPHRYSLPLIILFVCSTPVAGLNALGVDLIARGFTHAPFFLLLTIALFAKDLRIKSVSIFLATLVNGYLMLIVLPFLLAMLIRDMKRDKICLFVFSTAGLAIAALAVTSAATEKPFYFIFTESLRFDPAEVLKHAVPFVILAIIYRHGQMIVLLATSILFGTFIHYNPFFPIFMIYYSGSIILAEGDLRNRRLRPLAGFVIGALLIGFVFAAYIKYNPNNMEFYPRYDSRLNDSVDWILKNTNVNDKFVALTADENDLGLIMQYRPVYLGYIGHLSHLGLNWKERYNATFRLFEKGAIPDEVDYVFYGPVERKYFPDAVLPYKIVYRDRHTIVYKIK